MIKLLPQILDELKASLIEMDKTSAISLDAWPEAKDFIEAWDEFTSIVLRSPA